MLKSQDLIDKICAKIAGGGLTALETCQTTGALNLLDTPVFSVSTCANLPAATDYAGRMIYVEDERRYYHAFDGFWFNKFDSEPFNYKDTAWAWGSNGNGRLGDNTTTSRSSPVSVVGGFTDWCQISAGARHSLAVRSNGTAWAWGDNCCGQLGDNSTTSRSSPTSVVGGFTDWCQVAASQGRNSTGEDFHSLGIRQNGTLWAWGNNCCAQLGDNSTTSRSSPVSVVGGFTDWCQVSAGGLHTLAVRSNGTIWGWGVDTAGRLGDNNINTRSSPVSVVGGFTDWCQVSTGQAHSLGLRTNGTAWAWGCNSGGRLGDNTTTTRSSPVSVVGGFTDWCQVSAGGIHSLALRTNGTAWAWGYNGAAVAGVLGDDTTSNRSSPVSVVGGFTDWCWIAGGESHSVGIRMNGTAWAWGTNSSGVLGDNTTTNRTSPVSVAGGLTDWYRIDAAGHTLAIRQQCKGF